MVRGSASLTNAALRSRLRRSYREAALFLERLQMKSYLHLCDDGEGDAKRRGT